MTALTTQALPGSAGPRLTTAEPAGRRTTTPMNGSCRLCGCLRKPSTTGLLVTTTPFFVGMPAFASLRAIRNLLPGPRKYPSPSFRNESCSELPDCDRWLRHADPCATTGSVEIGVHLRDRSFPFVSRFDDRRGEGRLGVRVVWRHGGAKSRRRHLALPVGRRQMDSRQSRSQMESSRRTAAIRPGIRCCFSRRRVR